MKDWRCVDKVVDEVDIVSSCVESKFSDGFQMSLSSSYLDDCSVLLCWLA